jgi:hypothetical protein
MITVSAAGGSTIIQRGRHGSWASGLPTMVERPITSASRPTSDACTVGAAACGEPEPGTTAGDADRRQPLAGERAGGHERDPRRWGSIPAAEGAFDPGERAQTKLDEGRALKRRQTAGVCLEGAAEGHRSAITWARSRRWTDDRTGGPFAIANLVGQIVAERMAISIRPVTRGTAQRRADSTRAGKERRRLWPHRSIWSPLSSGGLL